MNTLIRQFCIAAFSSLLLIGSSAYADFITTDLGVYGNGRYDNDYQIRDFGSNAAPTSPLGLEGIPFNLPTKDNNFYSFAE